jgi:hypothetical protein
VKKEYFILVIILLLAALLPEQLDAQCAMCKATNESAMDEDSGFGINEGIIYLMGIPYILLGILGFMFFRKKIGGFLKEMREIHP